MNRIYKVIWSKVKNCYIVVSEIAKSHSKPISTKLNSGKTVAALLTVAALCAGMTTSVMAADQYYSVNDMRGSLANMGNQDNSGAQGIGSVAAGVGAKVNSASGSFQGAMATVVGSLNTIAAGTQTVVPFDGVANSIVGAANATQNANATLIFGAGNAVTNSYGNVTFDVGNVDPTDPIATAKALAASVGDSGGQVLVVGGANAVDYARFSAVTGVSNSLTGKDGNTSDYNFITGAKNTLTNTESPVQKIH
ncbi:ESPR domain-containing protein [uncultured Megasphaera sp.]|uniref:ESPR domain-containing protein n=1 Tax=uncultured Megasphaera sp. TaxID=165188 RepID=UPI00262E3F29|nr:ESPR domain-containing protein [uncultured Megasphaera sp.]